MENIFAKRVCSLQASAIREIFKLIGQPNMISFAGGVPDAKLYPNEELAQISKEILEKTPALALQYGTTDGYAPLKNMVIERMKKINSITSEDGVIITSGAQQAIDLAGKVLIEDGDTVVVEAPSFIGTLNSLRSYNANLVGVELQSDGMDLDQLEEILKTQKVKLIYTIKSLDTEGRVIYVGSFSKVLSPGLRLGWVDCRKDILERIEVVKQVNDVHTTMLSQLIAYEYITRYDFDAHIKKCCDVYGKKCEFMLECMDKYFPSNISYTRPEGGLFILCTLPKGFDTKAIFAECVERKVAYVPGYSFAIDMEESSNLLRLNYSVSSFEDIEKGIKILGEFLTEKLAEFNK